MNWQPPRQQLYRSHDHQQKQPTTGAGALQLAQNTSSTDTRYDIRRNHYLPYSYHYNISSSSNSSSVAELSEFVAPLGSPQSFHYLNTCTSSTSSFASTISQQLQPPLKFKNIDYFVSSPNKPRKQHTLNSIGNEKSRSRSPIVVGTESTTTTINHALEKGKRSRSLKKQKMNSEDEVSDELSLDHILANIEAGKLASVSKYNQQPQRQQQFTTGGGAIISTRELTPQTIGYKNNTHHLQQPPTELQEFKRLNDTMSHITSYSTTLTTSDVSSSSSETDLSAPISQRGSKWRQAERSEDDKRNEIANGFEIVWLNFTYSVEPNIFEDPRWGKVNSLFHKEPRTILKGLSGGLKSGQMVALMGPSGAGKTCLLECIAGIRLTGIGGEICLRGRKRAQLVIVPQYDDFMPQFTVEEIITYGSKMKNSADTDHKYITNTVIDQLGLQVCRLNNIQRCSGGQRKRVAIAQELVSRPNILILDEPTSGLDSSCCYQTMKVLRDVLDKSVFTEEPMAIVTTIHQPSAKVFKMFDSVYLLGKTGYTAFSGPPDELLPTIREVTGLECPKYSNPSDYMIELVSYDYGEEPAEKLVEYEKQKGREFVREYELRAGLICSEKVAFKTAPLPTTTKTTTESTFATIDLPTSVIATKQQQLSASKPELTASTVDAKIAGKLKSSKSDTHLVIINDETSLKGSSMKVKNRLAKILKTPSLQHVEYQQNISVPLRRATSNDGRRHPFFWHTFIHFHRSFLQSIRDPILNNMRILIHIGFATLLVLLYGKKSGEARGCPPILGLPTEITDPNNDSMIDLADNVGYLFMCIMMITYVSLMSTVLTFPIDIKTVGKEYKNGWYSTITYFLGKSIADMPFIIIYPVAYCLITWNLTNQAQDHMWRYFSFTGLIIMNAMNAQSFGLILGAVFVNSVAAATFLGPVITIPWYLFTGFTKRVHRLSEPYRTMSKYLFTRHVFEGLLDTVYGHERCNCSGFLQKYYEHRYEEAVRLGQLISVETLSSLDYYDGLETVVGEDIVLRNKTLFPPDTGGSQRWLEKTVDAATTVFADGEDLNLASLMETNVKASSMFSFGLDFEPTCPSNYKNYVVQDFRLEDKTIENSFVYTLAMLIVIRVLTFIVVAWKIRTRQL